MRRRVLLSGASALAVGCTGRLTPAGAIAREGGCPSEPPDEQHELIDAAVAVAVTVCLLAASYTARLAISRAPVMTAVWTFLLGVVLGCVIGWAIATLHSGLPRKPDAVALAALLDRIKRGK